MRKGPETVSLRGGPSSRYIAVVFWQMRLHKYKSSFSDRRREKTKNDRRPLADGYVPANGPPLMPDKKAEVKSSDIKFNEDNVES